MGIITVNKNNKEVYSMGYIELEQKVKKYILDNKLIEPNDIVIVATSGGADSMALLLMLNHMAKTAYDSTGLGFRFSLCAVTVNHGMRGETADRDMNFVESECKKLGVPCRVFNAKTDGTVVPDGAGEEWARELRYNYFDTLASELKSSLTDKQRSTGVVPKIATAHTLSDQAETVLFRLARNTTTKSLSGIPKTRTSDSGNYEIIRPFLCIARSSTEEICNEFSCDYKIDESNNEDDYSRNKIRHHVLPVLKKINSTADQKLAELANKMDKFHEYFNKQANNLYTVAKYIDGSFDLGLLSEADPLILEYLFNNIIEKLGITPSAYIIDLLIACVENKSGSVNISDDITIKVKGDKLVVLNTPKEFSREEEVCGLRSVYFRGTKYAVSLITIPKEAYIKLHQKALKTGNKQQLRMFTTSRKLLGNHTIIRQVDSNDKFKPACRAEHKMRKFYPEFSKVNVYEEERGQLPCIVRDGKVVWVWYLGLSDDTVIKSPDELSDTDEVVMLRSLKGDMIPGKEQYRQVEDCGIKL